jgi:hypothetical protein
LLLHLAPPLPCTHAQANSNDKSPSTRTSTSDASVSTPRLSEAGMVELCGTTPNPLVNTKVGPGCGEGDEVEGVGRVGANDSTCQQSCLFSCYRTYL